MMTVSVRVCREQPVSLASVVGGSFLLEGGDGLLMVRVHHRDLFHGEGLERTMLATDLRSWLMETFEAEMA
jgi:hypothetical protein